MCVNFFKHLPLFFDVVHVWCDNIGLVLLIYLGWELCVVYVSIICLQAIPILSASVFVPVFISFTCTCLFSTWPLLIAINFLMFRHCKSTFLYESTKVMHV